MGERIMLHTRQGRKELVTEFFKKMDANQDGHLSLDEFKTVIRTVLKFARNELTDNEVETLYSVVTRGEDHVDVSVFEDFLMDTAEKGKGKGPPRKCRLNEMYLEHA